MHKYFISYRMLLADNSYGHGDSYISRDTPLTPEGIQEVCEELMKLSKEKIDRDVSKVVITSIFKFEDE